MAIRAWWGKGILFHSFTVDACIFQSWTVPFMQLPNNCFDGMLTWFQGRGVRPETLQELFGRPITLWGNALVFWQDAVSASKKAVALKIPWSIESACVLWMRKRYGLPWRDMGPRGKPNRIMSSLFFCNHFLFIWKVPQKSHSEIPYLCDPLKKMPDIAHIYITRGHI